MSFNYAELASTLQGITKPGARTDFVHDFTLRTVDQVRLVEALAGISSCSGVLPLAYAWRFPAYKKGLDESGVRAHDVPFECARKLCCDQAPTGRIAVCVDKAAIIWEPALSLGKDRVLSRAAEEGSGDLWLQDPERDMLPEDLSLFERAQSFKDALFVPDCENKPGDGTECWPLYASDEGVVLALPVADCRGLAFLHHPSAKEHVSVRTDLSFPHRLCVIEHDVGEGRVAFWSATEDFSRAEFHPEFIVHEFYYPQHLISVPAIELEVTNREDLVGEELEELDDDEWIIVADGCNQKISAFTASTGECVRNFGNVHRWPWALCGASGQKVAVSSDDTISIVDCATGKDVRDVGRSDDPAVQGDRVGVGLDRDGLILRRKNLTSIEVVDPEDLQAEPVVLEFGENISAFCVDNTMGRLIVALCGNVFVFELASVPTKSANKR